MWLMTTKGFVSAVKWDTPGDTRNGMIVLRSRERQHLTDTLAYLPKPRPKVVETFGTDYRFRAWVTPEQFEQLAVELARAVTYKNFKGEVMREQGMSRYEVALHRVWSILGELQPGGPYARPKKKKVKVKGKKGKATCEDCGHKGPVAEFEVWRGQTVCRSVRDCVARMPA